MKTNDTSNNRNALVQTTLRVCENDDEIKVVSDRGAQTITSTIPTIDNQVVIPFLEFTPYSEIEKDSQRIVDLPRKALLQFDLERQTRKKSISLNDIGPKSALKKSLSAVDLDLDSLIVSQLPIAKMSKIIENQEIQTDLTVNPYILDEDTVANVCTQLSVQTSITFDPTDSLTNITKALKKAIRHTKNFQAVIVDGKILTDYVDPNADDDSHISTNETHSENGKVHEQTSQDDLTSPDDRNRDPPPPPPAASNKPPPKSGTPPAPLYMTEEEFEANVQRILEKTVKNVYDFMAKIVEMYEASKPPPNTPQNEDPERKKSPAANSFPPVAEEDEEEIVDQEKPTVPEGNNPQRSAVPEENKDNPQRSTTPEENKDNHQSSAVPDQNKEKKDNPRKSTDDEDADGETKKPEKSTVRVQNDPEKPTSTDEPENESSDRRTSTDSDKSGRRTTKFMSGLMKGPKAFLDRALNSEIDDEVSTPRKRLSTEEDGKNVGRSPSKPGEEDDAQSGLTQHPKTPPPSLDDLHKAADAENAMEGQARSGGVPEEESTPPMNETGEEYGSAPTAEEADPPIEEAPAEETPTREPSAPAQEGTDENITPPMDQPPPADSEETTPPAEEPPPPIAEGSAPPQEDIGDGKKKSIVDIPCECCRIHEGGAAPPSLSPQPETSIKFEVTVLNDGGIKQKVTEGVIVRASVSRPEQRRDRNEGGGRDVINVSVIVGGQNVAPPSDELAIEDDAICSCHTALESVQSLSQNFQECACDEDESPPPAEEEAYVECDCGGDKPESHTEVGEEGVPPVESVPSQIPDGNKKEDEVDAETSSPENAEENHNEPAKEKESDSAKVPQTDPEKTDDPVPENEKKETDEQEKTVPENDKKETNDPEKPTAPEGDKIDAADEPSERRTSADSDKSGRRTTKFMSGLVKGPKAFLERALNSEIDDDDELSPTGKKRPVAEDGTNIEENPEQPSNEEESQPEPNDHPDAPPPSLNDAEEAAESQAQTVPEEDAELEEFAECECGDSTSKEGEPPAEPAPAETPDMVEEEDEEDIYTCPCKKTPDSSRHPSQDSKPKPSVGSVKQSRVTIVSPSRSSKSSKVGVEPQVSTKSSKGGVEPQVSTTPSGDQANVGKCKCGKGSSVCQANSGKPSEVEIRPPTEYLEQSELQPNRSVASGKPSKEMPGSRSASQKPSESGSKKEGSKSSKKTVCICESKQTPKPSRDDIAVKSKSHELLECGCRKPKRASFNKSICDCDRKESAKQSKDDIATRPPSQATSDVGKQRSTASSKKSLCSCKTESHISTNSKPLSQEFISCDCGENSEPPPLPPAASVDKTKSASLKGETPKQSKGDMISKSADLLECGCRKPKPSSSIKQPICTCSEISKKESEAKPPPPPPPPICACIKRESEEKPPPPSPPPAVCTCIKRESEEKPPPPPPPVCACIKRESEEKPPPPSPPPPVCTCMKKESQEISKFTPCPSIKQIENQTTIPLETSICSCKTGSAPEPIKPIQPPIVPILPPPQPDPCDCGKKSRGTTTEQVDKIKSEPALPQKRSLSNKEQRRNICECAKSTSAEQVSEPERMWPYEPPPKKIIKKLSLPTQNVCPCDQKYKKTRSQQECPCDPQPQAQTDVYTQSIECYIQKLLYDSFSAKDPGLIQEHAACVQRIANTLAEEGISGRAIKCTGDATQQCSCSVEVLFMNDGRQDKSCACSFPKEKRPTAKVEEVAVTRSCNCDLENEPTPNLECMYQDEDEYNEMYMEELQSGDYFRLQQTESEKELCQCKQDELPEVVNETDRCGSKIEIPWLSIALPPPGTIEIKSTKEPKKYCECWRLDLKDSVLSATEVIATDEAKCECQGETKPQEQEATTPSSKPASPPPEAASPPDIESTQEPPPNNADDSSSGCSCSDAALDECEDGQITSMNFVYDNPCFSQYEPYMDPVYKLFPDDCDTYCGPFTEIHWSDILIPKKVKLREAKKSKPSSLAPQVGYAPDALGDDGSKYGNQQIQPFSGQGMDDAKASELEIELSFVQIASTLMKVEGGADSQHTVSEISTISDLRMQIKRCPKDHVVSVSAETGLYLPIVGSQPFNITTQQAPERLTVTVTPSNAAPYPDGSAGAKPSNNQVNALPKSSSLPNMSAMTLNSEEFAEIYPRAMHRPFAEDYNLEEKGVKESENECLPCKKMVKDESPERSIAQLSKKPDTTVPNKSKVNRARPPGPPKIINGNLSTFTIQSSEFRKKYNIPTPTYEDDQCPGLYTMAMPQMEPRQSEIAAMIAKNKELADRNSTSWPEVGGGKPIELERTSKPTTTEIKPCPSCKKVCKPTCKAKQASELLDKLDRKEEVNRIDDAEEKVCGGPCAKLARQVINVQEITRKEMKSINDAIETIKAKLRNMDIPELQSWTNLNEDCACDICRALPPPSTRYSYKPNRQMGQRQQPPYNPYMGGARREPKPRNRHIELPPQGPYSVNPHMRTANQGSQSRPPRIGLAQKSSDSLTPHIELPPQGPYSVNPNMRTVKQGSQSDRTRMGLAQKSSDSLTPHIELPPQGPYSVNPNMRTVKQGSQSDRTRMGLAQKSSDSLTPHIELPPQGPYSVNPNMRTVKQGSQSDRTRMGLAQKSSDSLTPHIELPPQGPYSVNPKMRTVKQGSQSDRARMGLSQKSSDSLTPHIELPPQGPYSVNPNMRTVKQGSQSHSPHIGVPQKSSDAFTPHMELPPQGPYSVNPNMRTVKQGSQSDNPRMGLPQSTYSHSPYVELPPQRPYYQYPMAPGYAPSHLPQQYRYAGTPDYSMYSSGLPYSSYYPCGVDSEGTEDLSDYVCSCTQRRPTNRRRRRRKLPISSSDYSGVSTASTESRSSSAKDLPSRSRAVKSTSQVSFSCDDRSKRDSSNYSDYTQTDTEPDVEIRVGKGPPRIRTKSNFKGFVMNDPNSKCKFRVAVKLAPSNLGVAKKPKDSDDSSNYDCTT